MARPKAVPRKKQESELAETNVQHVAQEAIEKVAAKADEPTEIIFGKPDISQAEIEGVLAVLRSGWIGTGRVAKKFEEEFAEFMGGGYAVAVSSCTMGLQLALRASNLGHGKEVLVSPLTFAATVNAIIREGATPVFVDVDERGCLDPDKIRDKMTDKTQGVIAVHYTGSAVNMGRLAQAAESFGLKVIEDAAHGFGGEYIARSYSDKPAMPRKLGTIGDYGVFSFYATKNITCGDGGMIVTRYGDMAERIRILANQGQTANAWRRQQTGPGHPNEIAFDGYKGTLPDLLAAVGLAQLRRWEELKAKRAKIWAIYENAFGLKEQGHSQHLYTIRVRNRDHFRFKLWEMGISTGIHYNPLHLEPGYKYLGYKKGDCPLAEKIGAETVSLPISTTMTEEDAERVVKAVKMIREAVD
jgi:dTDP-4-amino-4,6-dideoxygalactose transaminase